MSRIGVKTLLANYNYRPKQKNLLICKCFVTILVDLVILTNRIGYKYVYKNHCVYSLVDQKSYSIEWYYKGYRIELKLMRWAVACELYQGSKLMAGSHVHQTTDIFANCIDLMLQVLNMKTIRVTKLQNWARELT